MAKKQRTPVRGRAYAKLYKAVQQKLQKLTPEQLEQVAGRLDIHPDTLYNWQTARVQSPGIENLEKVAYTLRIDFEITVRDGVVGERKRKKVAA